MIVDIEMLHSHVRNDEVVRLSHTKRKIQNLSHIGILFSCSLTMLHLLSLPAISWKKLPNFCKTYSPFSIMFYYYKLILSYNMLFYVLYSQSNLVQRNYFLLPRTRIAYIYIYPRLSIYIWKGEDILSRPVFTRHKGKT